MPSVLLLAPTGVAASNINGITIHSGLNTPFGGKLIPLRDKYSAKLRNNYSEVEIVIIGNTSKASGKFFHQICKFPYERFSSLQDVPFGGKSVLLCADLYQLLPVQGKPVFMFN